MEALKRLVLNLFFAYGQKWFYTLNQNCYFVKVKKPFNFYFFKINFSNWEMYKNYENYSSRCFQINEKIEAIWGRHFEARVFCQNEKCGSLVIYGSKGIRMEWKPNVVVYTYVCSCCERTQNFLLESEIVNKEVVQTRKPCGPHGELLHVA